MSVQGWQIKRIHLLLGNMGKADDKEYKIHLVKLFTNYRETSTTKLTYDEAQEMIKQLDAIAGQTPDQQKADRQRKKIISYAHQMQWKTDAGKADMERINAWCVKSGYLHKPLDDYQVNELPTLVTQFEQVYKSFLKSI